MNVGALWLREEELCQRIQFVKIKGTSNPADLTTKHLARELLHEHVARLRFTFWEDRPTSTAQLHKLNPVSASVPTCNMAQTTDATRPLPSARFRSGARAAVVAAATVAPRAV